MADMSEEKGMTETGKSRIAQGAATVMGAFIINNLIGLFAKTLTARYFGTGIESSAFFAANRFSEILFNLVAGGALGSAFIPVFTGLLVHEKRKKAWKLASSIINLVTIVLLVLSIITIIFSKGIVRYILSPGFNEAEIILTARLLRIQVLSSIIFGISGLVMAILNSHQHFLLPAIAPAMYQIGWVIGITLISPSLGIDGLAWGVVIGSVLHLLVQVPRTLRLKGRSYAFGLGLKIAEVQEVARLMAPRLLGVAFVQLNFLLNTYLASFQQQGAITAISLAFPLMIMPEAAIAQSIAIAALPTFSALVADNKIDEMRSAFVSTLRAILLLAIPASVGLIMLGKPIVELLYSGQAFDASSVLLVSWALLWYAVGLVGHGLVEVTSRAFYALHDTKTPVFVGVGAMLANLGLSFVFSGIFSRLGWMPHGGLALANSTATAVESVILLVLMKRKLVGIQGKRIMIIILQSAIASATMGVVIWGFAHFMSNQHLFLRTGMSIVVGGAVYFFILIILKTSELREVYSLIRKKYGRLESRRRRDGK